MPQPSLDADIQWNANIAGLNMREQGNEFFESIVTKMSGASEPPFTYPYMSWVDISVSPAVWRIRSADNLSWNAFAQIDSSEDAPNQIVLLNAGVGIPSLGIAQTFTETQTIKEDGEVGEFRVGSTVQNGIVARVPLFGHNSNDAEAVGANLVLRQTTNTAGSEDFQLEIEIRRGGLVTSMLSIGAVNLFKETGQTVSDFEIVRQDGVDLNTIISKANSKIRNDGTFSSAFTLTQNTAGGYLRYTGSGSVTVTIPKLEDGSWVIFVNESSDNSEINFVSASGGSAVNFVTSRLTLPGGTSSEKPKCMVFHTLADGSDVDVLGQNTSS